MSDLWQRPATWLAALAMVCALVLGGTGRVLAAEAKAKPCDALNGIPCQTKVRDVPMPRTLPNMTPAGLQMTMTEAADARSPRYRFFSTVTVFTRNISGWTIYFRLFSKARAWVWPNAWYWFLAPPNGWTYYARITCRTGERICLGGFAPSRPNLIWGVGPRNNRPCWNCCFTCRTGTVRYTLTR